MKRIEAGERILIAVGKEKDGSENVYQGVLPLYEEEVAAALTESKRRELAELVTNPEGRVHAFTAKMKMVLAGALTARSSRSPEADITEVLWVEFLHSLGLDEAMIGRILDQFGDDSVREDASGHVAVRKQSVLTSMEVFLHPQVTGIEVSTRYVDFSEKNEEGRYRYVLPEAIVNSPVAEVYVRAMDTLFETYRDLWQPVWGQVVANNPKPEGVSKLAYETAVKGRVCDVLRKLLPLGLETNFVIHAHYRALSEVIMNLRASESREAQKLGDEMAEQLKQVNPTFVAMVDTEHGAAWVTHRQAQRQVLKEWAGEIKETVKGDREPKVTVRILNKDYRHDIVRTVLAWEYPGLPAEELERLAEEVESQSVEELVAKLEAIRTNRRHKVHEVFQSISEEVTYEGISFSGYKDLKRHRNLGLITPPDWSGEMGYIVPKEITQLGGWVEERYRAAQETALAAKKIVAEVLPEESKKLLTHGMKTAFTIIMGAGQGVWIEELRTIATGDTEYRWFAGEESRQRRKGMPEMAVMGGFVDYNEYELGRIKEAVRADLRGRQNE